MRFSKTTPAIKAQAASKSDTNTGANASRRGRRGRRSRRRNHNTHGPNHT